MHTLGCRCVHSPRSDFYFLVRRVTTLCTGEACLVYKYAHVSIRYCLYTWFVAVSSGVQLAVG